MRASNVVNETSLEVDVSRRSGKIMFDDCCVPTSYDEYIAMVKTGNEGQLSAYMMLFGKFSTVVCFTEESGFGALIRNGCHQAVREDSRYFCTFVHVLKVRP